MTLRLCLSIGANRAEKVKIGSDTVFMTRDYISRRRIANKVDIDARNGSKSYSCTSKVPTKWGEEDSKAGDYLYDFCAELFNLLSLEALGIIRIQASRRPESFWEKASCSGPFGRVFPFSEVPCWLGADSASVLLFGRGASVGWLKGLNAASEEIGAPTRSRVSRESLLS